MTPRRGGSPGVILRRKPRNETPKMVYLGLDSGTQSTKCIALDPETGRVLATAHSSYGMVPGLPPGHLEQHPRPGSTRPTPPCAAAWNNSAPARGSARHRGQRPAARARRAQRRQRARAPGETVVRHLDGGAVRAVQPRVRRGRDRRPDRQQHAAGLHRAEDPLAQAERTGQLPRHAFDPAAARLPQLLADRRAAHGIRRRLGHGAPRRAHARVE